MSKRIITLIIAAIIILIPFSSLANVTEGLMNDASQKADRTKKEGDKSVEKAANKAGQTSTSSQDDGLIDIDKNNSSNDSEVAADKSITDLSKGTYKIAWRILVELRRNSFPVCLIGIIIGAIITNILGPRNIVRKKLGISLMFGFLSFWVIAQVAPVVFWLLIQ